MFLKWFLMFFPNLNHSIYIFRDISSPTRIFLSTVHECISLEASLHFTVTSAFLGLGQNPQGSEKHVQCQNPWCQKQPHLISILKLPIKTCLMLQGAAAPPTPTAQQTQAFVSKANSGYCCSAVIILPSQPGLVGTSCSHCCLCQQPLGVARSLLGLPAASQGCQHPWTLGSWPSTPCPSLPACFWGTGTWLFPAS